MARPKGSKNKKENATLSDQILALEAEIESLQAQVTDKKNQIRNLKKAAKEEEKKRLLEAIEKSGKSVDEILAMLNS